MILITGASGFIGARLVQRLTRERGERVTALVRQLGTAGTARVAACRGVRLFHGDIRDGAVVDAAARGCESMVHCAVDVRSAAPVRAQVTAQGTRNVLDAAQRQGARHLVFLSTAAVHSWEAAGLQDETAAVRGDDAYSRSKLDAEAILRESRTVPVTILRPTCVYGPFSRTWTVTPVEYLRLAIPLLPSDNAGRANLIYIDNLIDLILAALDRPPAAARVYLATEEAPADWETLYGAYARTIGMPLHRFQNDSRWGVFREEVAVSWMNGKALGRRTASDLRARLVCGLAACHRHVPLLQRGDRFMPIGRMRRVVATAQSQKHSADGTVPVAGSDGIRPFAPRHIRAFYSARATFSAARARRELGWLSRIDAAEAIDRTCAWIKAANL